MDKLIELLKQIQELAGVAVDALDGASKGGEHGGPPHGGPPHEGGAPGGAPGGPPHEGGAPAGGPAPGAPDTKPDGDESGGRPPFMRHQ